VGVLVPYAYGNGRTDNNLESGGQFRISFPGGFAAVLFQRYCFSAAICEVAGRFVTYSPLPLMKYSYEGEFRFTVSHDVEGSEALLYQSQSSHIKGTDENR
jgi:hypothetical protein